MLTIPLLQTLSMCALDTEGMEHGAKSHAEEANVLSSHPALELLAARPAAPFAAHAEMVARAYARYV